MTIEAVFPDADERWAPTEVLTWERHSRPPEAETAGRATRAVAHDLNNLLTVISGYCDLLLEDLSAADPRRAFLDEIHRATERAAGLTGELLGSGRNRPRVGV